MVDNRKKVTGKDAASKAGSLLRKPGTPKPTKTVAASDLSPDLLTYPLTGLSGRVPRRRRRSGAAGASPGSGQASG